MSPTHVSIPPHPSQLGRSSGRTDIHVDPDGLCHCSPQPDSDSWGQCPTCKHLDARKALT